MKSHGYNEVPLLSSERLVNKGGPAWKNIEAGGRNAARAAE